MEEQTKLKKEITLVKLDTLYKLFIPDSVEQKIRYLCNKLPNKEWSGILFYKPEGLFEDDSLKINCVDIFVMDIGGATTTEFKMSPEVMAYMTEHTELMDCQIGLIHSHHSMSTFFSGTDTNTLREEGAERNHFVSLIVNNAGTYTAAITRKVTSRRVVNETFSYDSFDDNKVYDTDSWTLDLNEIQWFNLDIIKETDKFDFSDIDTRLKSIEEDKRNQSENNKYLVKDCWDLPYNNNLKSPVQYKIPFNDNYFKEDTIDNKEFEDLKVDPKLIHSLCLQLLTGSIMLPENSKLDITKWTNNLKTVVEKRFGKGEKSVSLYKTFIETILEFLVWDTLDPSLQNLIDSDYMATLIAQGMYDYIDKKLPKNPYVKICLDSLSTFIR